MAELTGDQLEELTCVFNEVFHHMRKIRDGQSKDPGTDETVVDRAYTRIKTLLENTEP